MATAPDNPKKPLLVALLVAGAVVFATLAFLMLRSQTLPSWLGGADPVAAVQVPGKTPIPGEHLPLGAPCFGEEALARKDYVNAYRAFMYRQADPRAALQVGVMYRDGLGVLRNPQMAIESFIRAANGGSRDALTALGWMFRWDRDTGTNFPEALRWFERAALQGDRVAAFYLADMYRNGNGGPKDLVRAYAWLSLLGDEPVAGDGLVVAVQGSLPVSESRHDVYKALTRDEVARAIRIERELGKQIAPPKMADSKNKDGEVPSCVR